MDKLKTAFDMFPRLETNCYLLREVEESDCNEIYDIYCDEEAVRYQQIEPMKSMEQAQKAIIHFLNGFKNKKFIRWCIADKNSGRVIGLITIHNFDNWNRKAEIGYMLSKQYWKKGIMSEAGEKVIEYAFHVIKLHRIEASVHPENIASNKLCIKLGFVKEGFKKEAAFNRATGKFEDRLIYGSISK